VSAEDRPAGPTVFSFEVGEEIEVVRACGGLRIRLANESLGLAHGLDHDAEILLDIGGKKEVAAGHEKFFEKRDEFRLDKPTFAVPAFPPRVGKGNVDGGEGLGREAFEEFPRVVANETGVGQAVPSDASGSESRISPGPVDADEIHAGSKAGLIEDEEASTTAEIELNGLVVAEQVGQVIESGALVPSPPESFDLLIVCFSGHDCDRCEFFGRAFIECS
jgi:hypothetical protein